MNRQERKEFLLKKLEENKNSEIMKETRNILQELCKINKEELIDLNESRTRKSSFIGIYLSGANKGMKKFFDRLESIKDVSKKGDNDMDLDSKKIINKKYINEFFSNLDELADDVSRESVHIREFYKKIGKNTTAHCVDYLLRYILSFRDYRKKLQKLIDEDKTEQKKCKCEVCELIYGVHIQRNKFIV